MLQFQIKSYFCCLFKMWTVFFLFCVSVAHVSRGLSIQSAALILVSRLLGETQWSISSPLLPGLRADNDRWCSHPGGLTGLGHYAM